MLASVYQGVSRDTRPGGTAAQANPAMGRRAPPDETADECHSAFRGPCLVGGNNCPRVLASQCSFSHRAAHRKSEDKLLTQTTRLAFCLALSGLALTSTRAHAAPEEVQVYMDEMDRRGEFGLDLHSSFVATGEAVVDYPGAQLSRHRLRLTPEFSYGLSDSLELGVYLPLTTFGSDGHLSADGAKMRIKYLAARAPRQRWFWGANFEVGYVSYKLDPNPWHAELKAIAGIKVSRWTLATNANFDFKLAGPASAPATLDIDTKLSYRVSHHTAIGVESYNGIGEFAQLGRFSRNDQSTYVTIDTNVGRWDLNLGLGRGYGANNDGVIIKAVIGVPL